jgi:hypothetical protein
MKIRRLCTTRRIRARNRVTDHATRILHVYSGTEAARRQAHGGQRSAIVRSGAGADRPRAASRPPWPRTASTFVLPRNSFKTLSNSLRVGEDIRHHIDHFSMQRHPMHRAITLGCGWSPWMPRAAPHARLWRPADPSPPTGKGKAA